MKITFIKLCQYIFTVFLLFSCSAETDSSEQKKEKEELTPTYKAKNLSDSASSYHHNPEKATLSGAYLSSRIARLHYDFDDASQYSQRIFSLDDKNNVFIKDQTIRTTLMNEGFEKSRIFAQNILSKDPQIITDIIFLIAILDKIDNKKIDEAIKIFEKYHANIFNIPVENLMGFSLYLQKKDYKKAQFYLDKFNGHPLFTFLKNYYSGLLSFYQKNYDGAEMSLRKAELVRDLLSIRPTLARAAILKAQNQDILVTTVFQRALKNQPSHILKQAQNYWEEKKDLLFGLPNPQNELMGDMLYMIGVLYSREGNYESSLGLLKLSNHFAENKPHTLFAMAEIYLLIKKHKQAANIYQNLSKHHDGIIRRDSLLNAVYSLSANEEHNQALDILSKAIKADPDFPDFYKTKGDILGKLKKHDEAILQYNMALEHLLPNQKKNRWNTYFMRGIAYEKTNQWKIAEKDLLKAMKLVPNNAEVVNYLAYSWIDRGENIKQSLLLLKKAVMGAPYNGFITDSYGWAYYKLKDYVKAEKILIKAVKLVPNDPIVNEHLGDIYWKLNRKREAKFQWQHALNFNPTEPEKTDIETKISIGLDEFEKQKTADPKNAPAIKKIKPLSEKADSLIKKTLENISVDKK